MYNDKRDKTLVKMLEIMNSKKISGDIIIQTEWNKTIPLKNFNITCASLCVLYYKINQEWRDHIIGIEHGDNAEINTWYWILDKEGEKIRNNEKQKHQIKWNDTQNTKASNGVATNG